MKALTKQQRIAVGVFFLNLLVLTPTVWIVSYLFTQQQEWNREVDNLTDTLQKNISMLKAEIAKDYVTKDELQSHADRVNDRLINLVIQQKQ